MSDQQPPSKSSLNSASLLGVVLAVILGVVGKIVFEAQSRSKASNSNIENMLLEASGSINKKLPMQIDKNIRLDSTIVFGNNLTYLCTVVNISTDKIDIIEFNIKMRTSLIDNYKSHPKMNKLRDSGTTLIYQFRDLRGVVLSSISISPKDF